MSRTAEPTVAQLNSMREFAAWADRASAAFGETLTAMIEPTVDAILDVVSGGSGYAERLMTCDDRGCGHADEDDAADLAEEEARPDRPARRPKPAGRRR